MKSYWGIILGIVLAIGSVQAQYIETQVPEVNIEPTAHVRKCGGTSGKLKIATFATNPPFGWTEKIGQSQEQIYYTSKGFGISLIQQIAKELNIPTQAVGFESDEKMRQAFENGAVDLIVGAYYDPKIRGLGHRYLLPAFIPNVITVVFMKGKERKINRFEDLIGLKGAARQDELFYPYIRSSLPKDLQIREAFDSREAFTWLLTGEIDFLLSSPYSAEAEARRFKLNKQISLISTPLMGQELFVIYSKKSRCPQFWREFQKKLREKRQDLTGLKHTLISFIDTWGQRFKDDPPLVDQLQAQGILPAPTDAGSEPKEGQ